MISILVLLSLIFLGLIFISIGYSIFQYLHSEWYYSNLTEIVREYNNYNYVLERKAYYFLHTSNTGIVISRKTGTSTQIISNVLSMYEFKKLTKRMCNDEVHEDVLEKIELKYQEMLKSNNKIPEIKFLTRG